MKSMMKQGSQLSLLTMFIFISLFSGLEIKAQGLKAVNDTIDLYPEIPKTVNLLANDTIPLGDSIQISGGTCSNNIISLTNTNRGFFTYVVIPYWGYNGPETGSYRIIDHTLGQFSLANILFRIHDHSYDSLDINNVKAAITGYGNQFYLPGSQTNLYKVPKDGDAGTIFNLSLWIAGKDADSVMYLAADKYRTGPTNGSEYDKTDFYAGPGNGFSELFYLPGYIMVPDLESEKIGN
jgi:hypothetical protein